MSVDFPKSEQFIEEQKRLNIYIYNIYINIYISFEKSRSKELA